jgi:hypothetical protein
MGNRSLNPTLPRLRAAQHRTLHLVMFTVTKEKSLKAGSRGGHSRQVTGILMMDGKAQAHLLWSSH